jgi:hypothetical protein
MCEPFPIAIAGRFLFARCPDPIRPFPVPTSSITPPGLPALRRNVRLRTEKKLQRAHDRPRTWKQGIQVRYLKEDGIKPQALEIKGQGMIFL